MKLSFLARYLSLLNQAGWIEARASAYTRPSRHWPGSLGPVRLRSQCCRGEAASSMVTMVTAVSVCLAHYHHTCSPPRVPPHTG